MNTMNRFRTLVLAMTFAAPILVFVQGCGESESTTTTKPSEEVKKSEASYDAEIAKQKAAGKTAK